jgi:hypothetical protein
MNTIDNKVINVNIEDPEQDLFTKLTQTPEYEAHLRELRWEDQRYEATKKFVTHVTAFVGGMVFLWILLSIII